MKVLLISSILLACLLLTSANKSVSSLLVFLMSAMHIQPGNFTF